MRSGRFIATIVISTLILGGCAATYQRQYGFDEEEAAPFRVAGNCTVIGQAFAQTRGGEMRYGAGRTINLMPLTNFNVEYYNHKLLRGETMVPADHPRNNVFRTTIADGAGNFEFNNVPAGRYAAYTWIYWEYATQYGMSQTGGLVSGTFTVAPGRTVKVILN